MKYRSKFRIALTLDILPQRGVPRPEAKKVLSTRLYPHDSFYGQALLPRVNSITVWYCLLCLHCTARRPQRQQRDPTRRLHPQWATGTRHSAESLISACLLGRQRPLEAICPRQPSSVWVFFATTNTLFNYRAKIKAVTWVEWQGKHVGGLTRS